MYANLSVHSAFIIFCAPHHLRVTMSKTATLQSDAISLGNLPEWNLADLYPGIDSPAYAADLAKGQADALSFSKTYAGKLDTLLRGSEPSEALGEAVRQYEAIEDLLGRLISYASLVYAGDTTDPVRAKFYGDTQDKLTAAGANLLFFTLELNRLDDALLTEAAMRAPLSRWRPWLADIAKEKPYQLDDAIEKLFLEKSVTGRSAWNRLYDETLASLRFEVRGETLTIEEALNKLQEPDGELRREASNALSKVFAENSRIFTLVTNTLAKDKEISDKWRGFNDIADSRHLSNRVEPEVVEALTSAVRNAYPRLSHRYYKLKARWLGKDVLENWDRNAPLPETDNRIIGWDEARSTVLEAYGDFSPRMADIARDFFDKNWIDAPTRPGKAPGAFAHPTVPSAHPYVLLNYLGKPRDVMTLAHELGHGVHQVLAAQNGALMAPTPLTLAETASVFGEMLTFRKLLAATENPIQRKVLLATKVEDMINTVVRQIAFYQFERKVHTARREGELTAEQINELWLSVQGESLGPAIRLNPGYETFWMYIPHFIHTPFYVYAYAFGDCLVNSLYGVYQNASEGFVEKYFTLLSAGGSKGYRELLEPFGLNAGDPAFWQYGLNVIDGFITELEALEV